MTLAAQLQLNPGAPVPLQRQLQLALMQLIDDGKLDGPLPSPGQLARDLRICTGSIRRAYGELVEIGIFEQIHLGYAVAEFS